MTAILKSCPFEEPVDKYEIENDKPMMTNEEWFCSLSTEEKAKELQLIYISGRTDEFYDKPQKTVRKFIQWLKQPHHNEVGK